MKAVSSGCLVGVFALACVSQAWAQESKSAALAKELAAALEAAKSDSIAAKDPGNPDSYIGALYFPGFELLVISGKYSAPALLDARLAKKEYKDIYLELNGAVTPGTKIFIEDMGLDGLRPKRDDNRPFDSVELGDKRTTLDGDWKKQKLSEDDYMKAFSTADERYAEFLTALIAEAKK
jgi:hypothetical protein